MRLLLLVGPMLLAACSPGNKEAADAETTSNEVGSYEMSGGETTARIRAEDGSITSMRSGSQVPVSLPAGFSVAPGFTVLNNTHVERGDARYVLLTMEGAQPVAQVVGFYRKQAEAAGIEVNVDVTAADSTTIAGKSRSGLAFSLMAGRSGDKTTVQLTLNKGMD
ncbi:hypothetical protein [Qipengyuania sp. RANM35]|uniref:hypothetical protein n=1 Tax=Qipengyuania sp. RANM35 TaxID=3068635 RepID=UPI0034DB657F